DVVRRIVDAGHLTGSASNMQPWHFVVVRKGETIREMAGLARTGPYIGPARLAIVVATEKDSPYGVSDASRAIQSMMLTAWADGVGSNWVGFAGLERIAKLVGLPDTYQVLAVLPFGNPKRPVGKGKKKRKPLGEVASAERFGTPFE
ncbi:MAG: nitroreductase family protein, partial [Candidatus Dormibacteraeota bacterium]|nr:nitroreductase family protein [Candidatus Dormibacteraeota bacterium]